MINYKKLSELNAEEKWFIKVQGKWGTGLWLYRERTQTSLSEANCVYDYYLESLK